MALIVHLTSTGGSSTSTSHSTHSHRSSLLTNHDHWGIWTSLFTAGAFSLWSEKTKVRSVLSGTLVSTLMALATTNLSIIASEVSVYSVVLEYLLPVAIHLLLFRADLRLIPQSIGALLLVFFLGSAAELHDFEVEKGYGPQRQSAQQCHLCSTS